MSSSTVKPWRLEWTPERVRVFWDWYADHPTLQAEYCSKSLVHSMLDQMEKYIGMRGTFVDFGSGPGFVTEALLRRGIQTYAFDSSHTSVAALHARLGGQPGLLGAAVSEGRMPLADDSADAVLLIETIEHLDAATGQSLLGEARRVLRRGGHVVITTPHEENLRESEIICPNCHCVFHRMQHLRTFGVALLAATVEEAGFRTVVCRGTYFSPFRGLHRALELVRRRVERIANPHLLYIGQRV